MAAVADLDSITWIILFKDWGGSASRPGGQASKGTSTIKKKKIYIYSEDLSTLLLFIEFKIVIFFSF